ncbi:winged helix-turn-helix domain-containing protein [Streptomyces sp. NPDC006529]|uniref:winged helix-turn-helix domain-containing protein n=1 Tax=Streptomyces sp. NPDC006529 TaxID=3157177 RepID=UPI0033BD1139
MQLDKGPATHGFEDERWTLVRVQVVIRRRLRVSLSVATVWRPLKRPPLVLVKGSRRPLGPGSSSRTRPASR